MRPPCEGYIPEDEGPQGPPPQSGSAIPNVPSFSLEKILIDNIVEEAIKFTDAIELTSLIDKEGEIEIQTNDLIDAVNDYLDWRKACLK